MAELISDSDAGATKPPPKRRRILDPSAIVPVPVYSSKVNSLRLPKNTPTFSEKEHTDVGATGSLWSEFLSDDRKSSAVLSLTDSEEEEAEHGEKKAIKTQVEVVHCPSPPPPESPVQTQSRQVKKAISEIDRRLQVLNSLLSPETRERTETRPRTRCCRRDSPPPTSKEDDDDVIVVNPDSAFCLSPYSSSLREIPLKIRCRTDVHRVPVLSSTPLRDVLAQLSAVLHVPASRLLLLREEVELATGATVGEIGLGIADIVECVVMAAEDKNKGVGGDGSSSGVITVKLQSKDRDSLQEFSLNRVRSHLLSVVRVRSGNKTYHVALSFQDAPMGSVFSQYLSRIPHSSHKKVSFYFDGSKVTRSQTPAQLDMEDGDIVEVWT